MFIIFKFNLNLTILAIKKKKFKFDDSVNKCACGKPFVASYMPWQSRYLVRISENI